MNYSTLQLKDLKGRDFIREQVRIRDGHACQRCFRLWAPGTRRFDVHHLDSAEEGQKGRRYNIHDFAKLVTLCHRCHFSLHSVRQKIKYGNNRKAASEGKDMSLMIIEALQKRLEIKWFRKMGWKLRQIATLYGVSHQRIHQILKTVDKSSLQMP